MNNDENQVRELAYYKWEKAGRPETDGIEFWLEAELEVYLNKGNLAITITPGFVEEPALKTLKFRP